MQEKKVWYINFTVDLNILDENKNALENLRREELHAQIISFRALWIDRKLTSGTITLIALYYFL